MTAKDMHDILANEKVTRYGGTITITGTDGSIILKGEAESPESPAKDANEDKTTGDAP